MSVRDLIREKQPIDSIAAAFNSLSHEGRLAEMYTLSREDQARLFELAHGRACHLRGDFVPAGTPPLTEVIHFGFNSLPAHRKFQKRFTWPNFDRQPPALFGYNEQWLKPITGPGYFTAHESPLEGIVTVVIDYTQLPNQKCEQWPRVLLNSARLSRWIYNGTMDWMWKVSDHVSIGRASRAGSWMDNWFVLCRDGRAVAKQ